MDELIRKFKEVLVSGVPIIIIVLVLHFSVSPLDFSIFYGFLIGAVLVILGLTVFLFGIDQGIEPIGRNVGNVITKSNSYAVLITASLILGFFISYAEPDLQILAKQINSITSGQMDNTLLVVVVSVGIGVMMTLGMLRILKDIRLKYVFTGAYALILVLSFFSTSDFLAIAFDASGATTGAITVPFILALAAGISSLKKDSKMSEADSFGLVGISSTGAILGVLITSIFLKGDKLNGHLPETVISNNGLLEIYSSKLLHIALESLLTLLPIIIVYIITQLFFLKQKKRKVIDIVRGLILTYVGLVVFLLGVNGGFMSVGSELGRQLTAMDSNIPVLLISLFLGLTTVLAEPAVHVLTNQVEEVTGGAIKRNLVLIFLSISVGMAIFISALRVLVDEIQLPMYLLPGFAVAVILSYFISDLFVGIAFDAGGVASGPMTATFSLTFLQGIAAQEPTADVIVDGLGMIAIVAMMPIIAIELLGVIYQLKLRAAAKDNSLKGTKGGYHG